MEKTFKRAWDRRHIDQDFPISLWSAGMFQFGSLSHYYQYLTTVVIGDFITEKRARVHHFALQVSLHGNQALFFMAAINPMTSSGTIPGGTAVF